MNKTIKKILIGIGVLTGIGIAGYLVLVALVWHMLNVGCGMDDGPFEAVIIEPIELSENAQEFDLSNNGKLILENRNDTLSPILTLVENGKVKWTLDTDTRNTEGFESTFIWKISRVTITENTDPIKLNFAGHWIYGVEAGSMEIDRDDGDNSFCLSW